MDLRLIRVIRKLSQWELAAKAGIPQSTISLAENGLTRLNSTQKMKLERVLDCPIDWQDGQPMRRTK